MMCENINKCLKQADKLIYLDIYKGDETYTLREAHWFKSSFTGNNAPLNTNGIGV